MVHSFEDLVIKVGSKELYCSSVDLSVNATVSPIVTTESQYAFAYAPDAAVEGDLKISYYITGEDLLYNYVINEKQPIHVDFAGLTINSGYLTSYGFEVNENDPVLVDVQLNFFEKVRGSLAASVSQLPEAEFLNSVSVSLSNGSYITHDDLISLSYTYGGEIQPNYVVDESDSYDEVAAVSVVSRNKDVSLGFKSYKDDLGLPVTGIHESVRIDLENRQYGVTVASYYVDGVITKKGVKVGNAGKLEHDYELSQSNLGGEAPSISWITDLMVDVGDENSIVGTNLVDIDVLSFLGFPCEVVSNDSINLVFKVSDHAPLSGIGPIEIITKAGKAKSNASMQITGRNSVGGTPPSRSWANQLF